jgi:hypothetical protein
MTSTEICSVSLARPYPLSTTLPHQKMKNEAFETRGFFFSPVNPFLSTAPADSRFFFLFPFLQGFLYTDF